MAKIGRNQACPCGSGKKYKKCCLQREEEERRQRFLSSREAPDSTHPIRPPTAPSPGTPGSGLGLTPYGVAKTFESSEVLEEMRRSDPQRAAQYWLPDRMRQMPTEAILEKLRTLGIEPTPDELSATAPPLHSAWELSRPWLARAHSLQDRDEDFIGLAACELWRRYHPDEPSFEMLDDAMQEGYRLMRKGPLDEAMAVWWECWCHLRDRLSPSIQDLHEADVAFPATQFLSNWLQDYVIELTNAAVDDPAWADKGVALCQDVAARFPHGTLVRRFRLDEAEFRFTRGDALEGERIFRALIAEEPDKPDAYALLSDCLGRGVRGRSPRDRPRAIALLEQALARPVQDADLWDIERRLRDLRSGTR